MDDKTHEITGTTVNFDKDIDNGLYKHYLARKLKPSIAFEVDEAKIEEKRLVILTIPAAKSVPTKFLELQQGKTFKVPRIGNSPFECAF